MVHCSVSRPEFTFIPGSIQNFAATSYLVLIKLIKTSTTMEIYETFDKQHCNPLHSVVAFACHESLSDCRDVPND